MEPSSTTMPDNQSAQALPDQELVKAALQDPERYRFIVERYAPPLLRYIRRLTDCSTEDAEDILQDVFLKMYRNLNDFDPGLKFSSWAYRIAHNEVISAHRKRLARPQTNALPEDSDDWLPDHARVELDIGIDRDLDSSAVRIALNQLEPKYRDPIVLAYFEGKSYAEISDILKKPPGTVATLINRGKERLRSFLLLQGKIAIQP